MAWPKHLTKTARLPFPELRELREAAGLSQLQLAERAHMNRSNISRIEAGLLLIDHYMIAKLKAILREASRQDGSS